MNVLIPAKGTSSRIPLKNMQIVGKYPLLGWAIWKARRWIPNSTIYVATEHSTITRYALDHGCTIYPLSADDVSDKRDAGELLQEFLERHTSRPTLMLDCSSPFLLRSELNAAINDPRDYVRPILETTLHLLEYRSALSQNIPPIKALQSPYVFTRRQLPITSDEWLDPNNMLPISWVSCISVNTPEDLKLAQWLGSIVDPADFDDTL